MGGNEHIGVIVYMGDTNSLEPILRRNRSHWGVVVYLQKRVRPCWSLAGNMSEDICRMARN